jgi:hypothetical protein
MGEVTLGADEPGTVDAADGRRSSGTGFYAAVAAWIPLGLFLLLVATPPTQSPGTDCGLWGCSTNNAFAESLLLVPGTPVILVLATWAHGRASRILEFFPDSIDASSASTARFLARLAFLGTIAAWAWVLHYWFPA